MRAYDPQAWERERTKGMRRFVLIRGVLSWGLLMTVAMAFVAKPFAEGFTSKAAIIHLVVWPLAGAIYGVVLWHWQERTYQKHPRNPESK
jgi:hypothetical protein